MLKVARPSSGSWGRGRISLSLVALGLLSSCGPIGRNQINEMPPAYLATMTDWDICRWVGEFRDPLVRLTQSPSAAFEAEYRRRFQSGLQCDNYGNILPGTGSNLRRATAAIDDEGKFVRPGNAVKQDAADTMPSGSMEGRYYTTDHPPRTAQPETAQGNQVRPYQTAPTATRGDPPNIIVNPIATTTSQIIDLAGKVSSKGRITSLTVNGTDTAIRSDGSFSIRRGIPLGDSDIQLVAIDEWGQSGQQTVKVTRTASANSARSFQALDPSKAKAKPRQSAVALIIGAERYKSLPPAEFAENDARTFYDYATNALGVPADRVRLLTGPDAGRLDVRKAVQTWLKPLIVRGQTDVFVFFSGHGLAGDSGRDLYLLPYDGDRDLLADSALRRRELIDLITEAGASSATLFLDTCYSGGTRGNDALIASARPILLVAKDEGVPPNVTILAAAGNDQLSSSLAPAKHGLFSYFLMKGLEGEAAGADRTITAATLEAYLSNRIPQEAAKLGRTQSPQLIGDGGRVLSAW